MKCPILFRDAILSEPITDTAAGCDVHRRARLSAARLRAGQALSTISNPTSNGQRDGSQLQKGCASKCRSAPARRSLTCLWPAHRCCCRAKRARLVPAIMLQHPGASHARARRASHLQAPTLPTCVFVPEGMCCHKSSVCKSCVEFFAAGTWHDRRYHVVQRRPGWDDVCASNGARFAACL